MQPLSFALGLHVLILFRNKYYKDFSVFSKETFSKNVVPDKVISSILSLLQWYIAKYLWWEVGAKERACSFTCLLVEVGEHVCMHCLN